MIINIRGNADPLFRVSLRLRGAKTSGHGCHIVAGVFFCSIGIWKKGAFSKKENSLPPSPHPLQHPPLPATSPRQSPYSPPFWSADPHSPPQQYHTPPPPPP